MTVDELLELEDDAQLAYLNGLLDEGKTVQEIGHQLGMRPEEVFRLSDFSRGDFLDMMIKGKTTYSKAEMYTTV